jgi:hypothetical protein
MNFQIIEIEGIEYIYDIINDKLVTKKIINNTHPDKPDIDLWESYLDRKLYDYEKDLIFDVIIEQELNKQISILQQNLINNNCNIVKLTNNDGNCLFESLAALGFGENSMDVDPHFMIRQQIASILEEARNQNYFFPNINISPEDIFSNSNEIKFIKNSNEFNEIYDYDRMLIDLKTNHSWNRLPTELILMTISKIFHISIKIHHNNTQYINEINVWKNNSDQINAIHLGQINEQHYLPVSVINTNEYNNIKLEYDNNKNYYNEWIDNIINNNVYENVNNVSSIEIEEIPDIEEEHEKLNLNDFEII